MALAFLRETGGLSPARQELETLRQRDPATASRLSRYLVSVEQGVGAIDNPALSYATRLGPDLYWYALNNEGVVFTFDGHDLVIIKIGHVDNASDVQRMSLAAESRL